MHAGASTLCIAFLSVILPFWWVHRSECKWRMHLGQKLPTSQNMQEPPHYAATCILYWRLECKRRMHLEQIFVIQWVQRYHACRRSSYEHTGSMHGIHYECAQVRVQIFVSYPPPCLEAFIVWSYRYTVIVAIAIYWRSECKLLEQIFVSYPLATEIRDTMLGGDHNTRPHGVTSILWYRP